MHLEYSSRHLAHGPSSGPGLNVAGVALPGVPGIVVGHNQRIAWGITNLHFDVQDLYVEKFDDRTGRYLFRGQIEQARPEGEIIRVKGQPPTEFVVWVTRHGPLFLSEGKDRLALRWTAAERGLLQFPFLEIDRAQNWQQFTAAISSPDPVRTSSTRMSTASFYAVGQLPAPPSRRLLIPGSFEWDGFIPFDQLPSVFNHPAASSFRPAGTLSREYPIR
jgi:penicillin amidase